jgi:serine/threonine protein kinase
MIGETVQGYRILRALGEGAIGVVYVGQHEKMGRRAAVKLLRPELSSNADLMGRFFDEARAATMIEHPGVAQVFDCGIHPPTGQAFIVMELLDGESLRALLGRSGSLPLSQAARLIHDIAEVLGAVHERGIVHRDLKPDNVFLPKRAEGRPARVKVLDFGIAKLSDGLNRSHQGTLEGSLLGTPAYMAPEQCRGAANTDARVDIYALGCIFFELLTGRPPFVGTTLGALVSAHLVEQPPELESLNCHVPSAVTALIKRCLAKQADARPIIGEIIDETQAMTSSVGTQVLAPPSTGEASKSGTGADPAAPGSTQMLPPTMLPPTTTLQGAAGVVSRPPSRPLRLGAAAAALVAALGLAVALWPSRSVRPSASADGAQSALANAPTGYPRGAPPSGSIAPPTSPPPTARAPSHAPKVEPDVAAGGDTPAADAAKALARPSVMPADAPDRPHHRRRLKASTPVPSNPPSQDRLPIE